MGVAPSTLADEDMRTLVTLLDLIEEDDNGR